jgi:hypothetical protein
MEAVSVRKRKRMRRTQIRQQLFAEINNEMNMNNDLESGTDSHSAEPAEAAHSAEPAEAAHSAEPEEYDAVTTVWKTQCGDYEIICELSNTQNECIECPIMQQPVSSCLVDDLPATWTMDHMDHAGPQRTANTVKLPCQHTFYAPALALHFLTSDMRCPVCRAGSLHRMDLLCVPCDLRDEYRAKLSSIHQNAIQMEIAVIDDLHVTNVLSELHVELRMFDVDYLFLDTENNGTWSSLIHTRVIYDDEQVQTIQRSMQNTMLHTASADPSVLQVPGNSAGIQNATNFNVHRSFQRLIRSIIGRQCLANPNTNVVFAVTHPLLPVSFCSAPLTTSNIWIDHFTHDSDSTTFIPLYCPSLAGAEAVANVRFDFFSATHTTNVTIDINLHIIINISSYVTEVLNSIQQSVLLHTEQVQQVYVDNTVDNTDFPTLIIDPMI